MEPARQATEPGVSVGEAVAIGPAPPHDAADDAAMEVAPPPPPPPVGAGAAGPGLLYYAVWLPAPQGGVQGPPVYLPSGGGMAPAAPAAVAPPLMGGGPTLPNLPGMAPAGAVPSPEQAHNQRLLVWAIIICVLIVHLPWIAYLVAVHGCWGTFIDVCWQAPVDQALMAEEADPFAETVGEPYLFARIVFLMLRVQAVLSSDWAEYSQAMQLSTGLGSFVLTRIVASNGMITQGREKAIYMAAMCLALFLILFWVELHLTSDTVQPLLGDDTVLDYISQNLPPDFASYGSVRDGLLQLLQFLRLADALILGACLALPTTQRKPA